MIHRDIIQGTPEWFDVKRGKISASHIKDIQAGGKGLTRDKYQTQIVLERLTGKTAETYSSPDMERGIELEADARRCYEFDKGVQVDQVGFIDHPFIENYGCSPDGLVGEDGMCEIKTVIPTTMLSYIDSREIPVNYQKQMQGQMDCAERKWNDFVAYCPDMPINLQLLVIRLERDEAQIQEQRIDIVAFDEECKYKVEQLRDMQL